MASDSKIRAPKKLIEVALPLDAINKAAAREKSIRHGHPSTLHLWWARRPLAAARAVLFAQLVNDPGGERGWGKYKGQTKEDAERERKRLFDLIEQLVQWENTNNEEVLEQAREEIRRSWRETCEMNRGQPGFDPDKLPPFHDPFAGGGSIPLEAQRLGLEAHASDLNPVAVLINKAMIEIPPRFAGRPPVGPPIEGDKQTRARATEDWSGARGLAEDVRRYGAWMRDEAFKRVGHLYPPVKVTKEMARGRDDLRPYVGRKLTVIAWLWARTVASPDPATRGAHVPLVRSFILSKMKGNRAWIEIDVDKETSKFNYRVKTGQGQPPTSGTIGRNGATCILSRASIPFSYIREQGRAHRLGHQLLAVVADGDRGRVFLGPAHAPSAAPVNKPKDALVTELPGKALGFRVQNYGMRQHRDIYTDRQLHTLSIFSDLVSKVRDRAARDALAAGWDNDGASLAAGGSGAQAYGDAIAAYMGIVVSSFADRQSALCTWDAGGSSWGTKMRNTFSRNALPMVWDFAEANPFSEQSGSWDNALTYSARGIVIGHCSPAAQRSTAQQADARHADGLLAGRIISTDPPYYDNIGYAELSDCFYVWLRRSLRPVMPAQFTTVLVPKVAELVATPFRHGDKNKADAFFMEGMTKAMTLMAAASHRAVPCTIYYAFKQAETKGIGTVSTGWETFLEAVIRAGFVIAGTWPLRSELSTRLNGIGSNALASSILLVCGQRSANAKRIARRQFLRTLCAELPLALEIMIGGTVGASPIAPVDLAQAAIGPGMAVFSRYSAVLEADGTPMTVHDALIHINKAIDDYFTEAEGEMDSDTRFCVDWFQQYGFAQGPFGEADVLARAKGTSVDGVTRAGVVRSGGGRVELLQVDEYAADWDPRTDDRTPVWEACHQLCRALQQGETAAGVLLARMPERQEPIRQLAYRLYTVCERKKWAAEARSYNELITSWQAIVDESRRAGQRGTQTELDL